MYQSGDPEHEEDDRSLGEVLQGSHNIVYEAKDDTTGVSFERNGVKEWVPIVVTNYIWKGARCERNGEMQENCVLSEQKWSSVLHKERKMSVPHTNC